MLRYSLLFLFMLPLQSKVVHYKHLPIKLNEPQKIEFQNTPGNFLTCKFVFSKDMFANNKMPDGIDFALYSGLKNWEVYHVYPSYGPNNSFIVYATQSNTWWLSFNGEEPLDEIELFLVFKYSDDWKERTYHSYNLDYWKEHVIFRIEDYVYYDKELRKRKKFGNDLYRKFPVVGSSMDGDILEIRLPDCLDEEERKNVVQKIKIYCESNGYKLGQVSYMANYDYECEENN